MVEAVLASNHHIMFGSHRCSVHHIPLRLHRPVETMWWDSRSLRGHSSDLWGSVSSNKISSLKNNAVNKQNSVHRGRGLWNLGHHLLRRSLHPLGYGLALSHLLEAMDGTLPLLHRASDCGSIHRGLVRQEKRL